MKLFCSMHVCLVVLLLTMPFVSFSAEIILPSLEFPEPTGQYKVGTTYLHFLDKTRPETLTKAPGDFRELEIQAWYPAKPGEKNVIAQYWRNPDVIGPAVVQVLFSGLPESLGTIPAAGLHKVAASRTHSYLDAPVEDSRKKYPVLIFSHGYAGLVSQNTAQMEELASHGYIIFSISHTYEAVITLLRGGRTAKYTDATELIAADAEQRKITGPLFQKLFNAKSPEEKMKAYKELCKQSTLTKKGLTRWAADIKFVVDKLEQLNRGAGLFKGKLDLDKIGALGHSFGGGASVQACFEDKRIKACINMDMLQMGTWHLENALGRPFMHMLSEETQANAVPYIYNTSTSAAYLVKIKGTKHYNYSDMTLFPPLFEQIGFLGAIDGKRCIKIYSDYSRAFFDRHLEKKEVPLLDGPSKQYPEVTFTLRNPEK
jgi:dienelactone hydrolase